MWLKRASNGWPCSPASMPREGATVVLPPGGGPGSPRHSELADESGQELLQPGRLLQRVSEPIDVVFCDD